MNWFDGGGGSMEVYGLDDKFGLVTAAVPYFNLQWNRKYYDAGDFSIQISADVYDPSWAYIMTHDRPEVGIVQKLQYTNNGGEKLVQLSGFFAEQRLNGIVASPRFVADLSKTENVIKRMFDTYGVQAKKGIGWKGNAQPLGDRTQCDFIGDLLGEKWYSILETRELSYRLTALDDFSGLVCQVWQGVDRTQSQDANPWCVFSSAFGNMEDEEVSIDRSAYANVCKVSAKDEALQFEVDLSGGGERFEVFLDKGSEAPEEGQSEEDFEAALRQEALEKLADCVVAQEIDVSNLGDANYLEDFDLGDKVSLILDDIGLELETRIVEVAEVFKPEGHSVQLGFGSKRITNMRRSMAR